MTYVGQEIPSLTNTKLVAGKGTFVDDISLPGMAHAAVLRSPYAHARIRSIDTARAEALPGVLCVVTGSEVKEQTNPIPETYDTAAVGAKGVKWYALCVDRARYVGEAVAAVVAEDRFTAYAALDLIEVDYEELPVAATRRRRWSPARRSSSPSGATTSWRAATSFSAIRTPRSRRPTARSAATSVGPDHGHCDRAARVPRLATTPTTTRSRSGTRRRTRTRCATTSPGRCGMPETSIRVVQPHVGGGFGLKIPTFQEEPLVAYLSRKLRRPVKWIEERSENFQTGGHARDTRFHYEAAYKNDGTVTGIRLTVIADVGAPSALCGWGMSFVTWYCLPCVYKIPNSETHLRSGRDEQVPVERLPRLRQGRRVLPDGPDHGSHRQGDRARPR